MLSADWATSGVTELDISSTDLSEECLLDIFSRMPKLTYLAVPNCDGFTDQVNIYQQYTFNNKFFMNIKGPYSTY